jgi:hypothetical protein
MPSFILMGLQLKSELNYWKTLRLCMRAHTHSLCHLIFLYIYHSCLQLLHHAFRNLDRIYIFSLCSISLCIIGLVLNCWFLSKQHVSEFIAEKN